MSAQGWTFSEPSVKEGFKSAQGFLDDSIIACRAIKHRLRRTGPRLHRPGNMEANGLQADDIIELRNVFGRYIVARVGQPIPTDRNKGLTRIDHYTRQGLKA